jgi:UDP:flavonoid glycosyltransferase YjiC (YdhE family)/alpha-ketoglutarate-dependent taurine dioxygenase
MANILLTTHWSHGEVYPFIQIGSALKARGHNVTLITNCCFQDAIAQAGLDFLALDTPDEFDRFTRDGHLFNSPQGFLTIYQRYVLPKVLLEYRAIAERYRPQDTVLVARSTPGIAARFAAQKLDIPLVTVMSSPSHLSTMSLVEELIQSVLGDEINRIGAEIGVSPIVDWKDWLRKLPQKTIGLWSDWFVPPNERSPEVLQPGFIWQDETSTDIPSEVREFLDREKPPILITGGTTSLAGEKFFAVSVEACRLLDRRGLLVTKHKNLVPDNLCDRVKWVEYLPSLAKCLPNVGAIIHHGGLVTSGQALAAGVPQLALAIGADRLYTGSCLKYLGVGEFLPQPQWQPDAIAQCLQELLDPAVRKRAQELAGRFAGIDPVDEVCRAIEAVFDTELGFFGSHAEAIPPTPLKKGEWRRESATWYKQGGKPQSSLTSFIKNDKSQVNTGDLKELIDKLSPEKLALLELKLTKKDREIVTKQTIPRLPRQTGVNYFPLSFAQERLWFVDRLEPGNPTYNIFGVVRLTGTLNVSALERAFNAIARRHESLRTTFAVIDDCPVQAIAPTLTFSLPVIELKAEGRGQRAEGLIDMQKSAFQQIITAEQEKPFNLSKESLLRVTLLKIEETEHLMLFSMHHIIADGWSMGILIRELTTFYEGFCTGKAVNLPQLPIQYGNFAVWQRQWLQGDVLESQLAYWKQQLKGNLPRLNLPMSRPRPQVPSFRGADYSFTLEANLSRSLQNLAHQENVTLFMTLLAAFQTLLHRYTKQEDIIVGTDVANRNRTETEGLIGFFINLLVLRTDLSGNPSFRELLDRVREVALGAYAHQDLPFAKLVEELQPERKLQPTPLFQVLFVMQNVPMPARSLLNLTIQPVDIPYHTTKFDLALFMEETEKGIVGTWNYSTDLFDASAIARMTSHFETLLESIVIQPDARIGDLEMLPPAERQQQAMQQKEQKAFKRAKFVSVAPKAISLSSEQLVKLDYLQPGQTFPLVIQPKVNEIDAIAWAKNNREFIETNLLKHGAILFRDFQLDSIADFEKFAQAICPELFGEYGDLPREGVGGKVYGTTPYPPDKAILFHNESSHLHRFPLKIWFFCDRPAAKGGETPIVDCRKIYQLLDANLREKFLTKKLLYVRNYTEELDVSWQEFFHTQDKTVVEDYCRQAQITCEWLSNSHLRTRKLTQAIAKHPKTGELVFFNQLQLHHISCLDLEVRESLLSLFSEDKLPRNVYYGDGSTIEDSVMTQIQAIYQQATVSFPWQKGDVLMLDNMLTAHGRNRYIEPRKIVVAMGEMIANN